MLFASRPRIDLQSSVWFDSESGDASDTNRWARQITAPSRPANKVRENTLHTHSINAASKGVSRDGRSAEWMSWARGRRPGFRHESEPETPMTESRGPGLMHHSDTHNRPPHGTK